MDYQKPFILDLPNSVLKEILELVYTSSYTYRFRPILFVCRRFYQLGIPLQYKYLWIDYRIEKRPDRSGFYSEGLGRTLQEDLGLGQHCRELSLHIKDEEDIDSERNTEHFPIAQRIISTLPNVHSLRLSGGFSSPQKGADWNLLRSCVASMPSLQTVTLSLSLLSLRWGKTGPHGLDVRTVMEALGGTSVRRLVLEGVALSNSPVIQWTSKDFEPTCITELELDNYSEWPKVTRCLLDWPEALTSLVFARRYYDDRQYMDLPKLGKMLTKHKDSLVKLSVGRLSEHGRGRLFDISGFIRLGELELDMWQMVAHWPTQLTEKDYGLLLPPNLKLLRMRFYADHNHLHEQAGDWLLDFAMAAVRKNIPLQEIIIDTPGSPPSWWEGYYEFWDTIHLLRGVLWCLDIKLTLDDGYS